jgi:hypothetical protein
MCSLHYAQGDDKFPGLSLKTNVDRFFGLGLKIGGCGLVICPTKSPRWFLSLGLKTKWSMLCQFAPQNRCADEDGIGHVSWSSGLLYLEASWTRVSQFCLETGEGVMTSGAHGIIVKVAWKWSKRRSVRWRRVWPRESRTKYPLLAAISFSVRMGILVFWLDL